MISMYSLPSQGSRRLLSTVSRIAAVFVMIFAFVSVMHAQVSSSDLSSARVDQMTDAQVMDIYTKFRTSGMTEQQFSASLAQRKMPAQEIEKLKARMNKLAAGGGSTAPQNNGGNQSNNNFAQSDTSSQGFRRADSLSEYERKIFGYTLFHNSSTSFSPNLNMATPKSYIVGPSDVLAIQVYGVAQSTYSLPVNRDGNVYIQDIGLVHVAGFSLDAVKNLLRDRMAIRYSGMGGSNPNTFIEVTISNIRTIKINMVGEVSKPGTFTLPSYIDVFDAIYAAGGPTVRGTFRDIQVFRAGRLVGTVDLYDFLVKGKSANAIRLEDNDVVLVRPATNRVELVGEVRIPGIFEFKGKESFTDIVGFAGGFTDNAYKQMVSVSRKGLVEKQILSLSQSQYATASLNDGDVISIEAILDRFSNRVMATGAISRPGAYELVKGMTVRDLIQKAGGVKGDAFMKRALLYRTNPDFTQSVISLDLSSNSQTPGDTVTLQREDILSVANVFDLKEEYYVQISGEVNAVGVFPYADNMTVGDLILKAGGFKYSASGSYIEIVRRTTDNQGKAAEILRVSINKDLTISEENKKIVLDPFDHVYVRTLAGYQPPKTVTIQGEVLYPGNYVIDKKEMRISDLLNRASGFTKYAYARGATLIRRTKNYDAPTPSELENAKLNVLKDILSKDTLAANSESNRLLTKRIDNKIRENMQSIDIEKDAKNRQKIQENLFKDNTSVLATNNSTVLNQEKTVDLVAIDLDRIAANPGSEYDLIIKDGDVLSVPEILETISVRGGVLYPVSIRYEQGLGFREYINRAGGYSSKAIRKQAYVLQANGRVQRVKSFLFFKHYPKPEPGAEIIVPITTAEKPPFNIAAALSVITTALTIIVLLKTL